MAITKFYYDEINTTFLNVIRGMHIAFENHLSENLFPKETNTLSRIVYASNEFAFRKRTKGTESGRLDLPFCNYYLDGVTEGTDRKLKSNVGNVDGRYVPELNRKVKYAPITLEYEATAFFNQTFDLYYALSKLLVLDSNETVIYSEIDVGQNRVLQVPGFVEYTYGINNLYNENDWLEQNKIQTLSLDVTIQTLLLLDDGLEDTAIAEEILFTFLSDKNLNKEDPLDSATASILLQEYFDEDDLS